jgi:hypothetical protein
MWIVIECRPPTELRAREAVAAAIVWMLIILAMG